VLVSLERSGGFTGRRTTSAVDTDELTGAQMAEALRALEALASAPPTSPPSGPSQPRYRVTLHRSSGPQVVDMTESQVPPALRPLLTELIRRERGGA
jgi:hypothetical protein